MAARDVRSVIEHFRELRETQFNEENRSLRTKRMYEKISSSPKAAKLLEEGYPVRFALRVAELEGDS